MQVVVYEVDSLTVTVTLELWTLGQKDHELNQSRPQVFACGLDKTSAGNIYMAIERHLF
jgi:hypothetical protein